MRGEAEIGRGFEDKRVWTRRARDGSLRKAQTRRKEMGTQEETGKERSGERNVATGCLGERGRPGGRSGCRVWPPWGQGIQGRAAKGIVMEGGPERVNDPGGASTTVEKTDGKKGTVSPAWRPEGSLVR